MIVFFFFNDTATTEIYTLSLHDALPIYDLPHRRADRDQVRQLDRHHVARAAHLRDPDAVVRRLSGHLPARRRSEEHTSELQSRQYLVCRLLLEKKTYCLRIALRTALTHF